MENWGEIIRLIGSLGNVGSGLYSSFRKEPIPYGIQEGAQAAQNASTYMAASADPNSPYFRNIAATEEQRGRNDLIASIDRIMREIASRGASGRGTINPERRDETIWGLLTRGFQEAGMKAREMARTQLLNMAGGEQRNAAAYGTFVQPSMLNSLFNRENQNKGLSTAFTGIERIGEYIGSKKKPGTKDFGTASVPDAFRGFDYYGGPR